VNVEGTLATVLFKVKEPVISHESQVSLANVQMVDSAARRINVNFSGTFLPQWLFAPTHSKLHQNYPNPFNPETWIPFELSEDTDVKIQIFNMKGNLVRRFNLGRIPAGYHVSRDRAIHWDGQNEKGEKIASGAYFYTLQAGKFRATRKMVIVK